MSRVVWTEHRPKLEISNRPASWTDQLDHGTLPMKVKAPHFRAKQLMEILNPIRPNLHTPNHGTSGSIATAAAAL